MIRSLLTLTILLSTTMSGLQAQSVDHWEAPVLPEETDWRYHIPSSEPAATWTTVSFDDSSWSTGPGGFGYGDGDDNTVVPAGVSIYLRKTFTITDLAAIEELRFFMDFDDGFVAHLNGTEFARSSTLANGGTPVPYDEVTDGEHEAVMYQGDNPEEFASPLGLLQQGVNVLAIQIHNWSANSSDMSAIPFLIAGINNSSNDYSDHPTWFVPEFEFETHLPIVIINTGGLVIPDNNRILVELGIIYNGVGVMNNYNDPWIEFSGIANIEQRGSSSAMFPKKQYAFETQDALSNPLNVTFLSFPMENDWVLHAPYSDKSLLRNVLAYDLAMEMGITSSRNRWCELILNGEYKGVYVMLEQIKWDANRVDVEIMDENDNTGDALTGGYIVKVDKATGSGILMDWPSNFTSFNGNPKDYGFQYDYPKRDVITQQQEDYIQDHINEMEAALGGATLGDPETGYRKYLDLPSWVDYFIINELTKDVDSYRLSTYLAKQRDSRGGKITMGPVWDQNLGFGNANYCGGQPVSGWAFQNCTVGDIPIWWEALLADDDFLELVQCRWMELREYVLDTDKLMDQIDNEVLELGDAAGRNFNQWPILGQYVWPNAFVGNTYAEEIQYLKDWIEDRLVWIDQNIGDPLGTCTSSMADQLIVSEINYNDGVDYPTDDWFELYNGSAQPLDLSFVTIKDQNNFNSFTFPMGTQIMPDSFLVVCRDLAAFTAFHPLITNVVQGSFNWGLGGGGDKLRMWDVNGFPVYDFLYSSSAPWPTAANGDGPTMEWDHSQTDQSDGNNWFEGCPGGSPGTGYYPCTTGVPDNPLAGFSLYPNPTNGLITVQTQDPAANVSILDIQGRMIADLGQAGTGKHYFNLNDQGLIQGLYYVRVEVDGITHQKPVVINRD